MKLAEWIKPGSLVRYKGQLRPGNGEVYVIIDVIEKGEARIVLQDVRDGETFYPTINGFERRFEYLPPPPPTDRFTRILEND